jgi:hypothetical protein
MMKAYQAKSLDDIAQHFEDMARACEDHNDGSLNRSERAAIRAEFDTWKQAAEVIRATEMKMTQ